MTKIYLKVFCISLKLFKALLVNRLQVEGGANMTKHQFGALEDTVTHHLQATAEPGPSILL